MADKAAQSETREKAEVSAEGRERLEKLTREVEELRLSNEQSRNRALLLEERMKQEALADARMRVLEESVARQGVALDVSKAAGLLAKLTGDAVAEVDETGKAFVAESEQEKIREQVDAIINSLSAPPRVVAPPIAPGEPPTRSSRSVAGDFGNCWDAAGKRRGSAKGKELIAAAAKELEREGVL